MAIFSCAQGGRPAACQLRLMIHSCESPRAITKHCSMHPGSLPSQVLPMQGYCSPRGCWTSALLQPQGSAGSLASAMGSECWVSALPQPLQAPFLTPVASQLWRGFLAVLWEGSSTTCSNAVHGPSSPVLALGKEEIDDRDQRS